MSNSHDSISFGTHIFNFKKQNGYYVVISESTDFANWIDSINMYSISKKPSKDKLIDKIKTKLNTDYNVIEKTINQELNKEMMIYKELERIKQIEKEGGGVNLETTGVNLETKAVKKIFNDSTVKDVIIKEYINIYSENTDKISINISDNVFQWTVKYNIKAGQIIMEIKFDSKYFPYAPPQICIISPQLCDKLAHRLSNSKIFKLDYWNPVNKLKDIIYKIYDILDKNAKVDNFKSEKKINQNLYQKLLILSSYISNDEDLDEFDEFDQFIIKQEIIKSDKKPNKKTVDKFNGTGYRSGDTNKWKIEDYENLQKTKEFELISVLTGINTDLDKINKDELYDTLESSMLIKFLSTSLMNTTLLEMSKKIDLYKICFNIIQNICDDKISQLLFDSKYNLYNSIKKLYELCRISAKFDNSESNDIVTNIMFIWSMYEPLHKCYEQACKQSEPLHKCYEQACKQSEPLHKCHEQACKQSEPQYNSYEQKNKEKIIIKEEKIQNIDNTYIDIMTKYRFDTCNISNYRSVYANAFKSTKTSNNCMKRLSSEIPTLAYELPIHSDASIFLRVDENNPRAMRALITGPPDTPYDSGIFIFDIYLPPNYPTEVPMVNFTNTGNKRFNPNLYNCGKVCLSILGTYVGPTASQTEKWNTSSTLYQVLISIQGQILVEQPYFNEPGYQNSYKTPTGDKASEEYNKNITLFTMQHAMYELMMDNKFPEFKDVIENHFTLKKNKIIDICTRWIEKSKNNNAHIEIAQKIINYLMN